MLLILGFYSRDETAMLVYKTIAKVLHNNRIKFTKGVFRYCSVHQHGRRDVTGKPRIRHGGLC